MVIRLEGKEHRQGTSKRGQAYDFIVLHFLGKSRGVDGLGAIQKLIDPDLINYDDLLVGQHYELEPDLDGNIIAIKVAKA